MLLPYTRHLENFYGTNLQRVQFPGRERSFIFKNKLILKMYIIYERKFQVEKHIPFYYITF